MIELRLHDLSYEECDIFLMALHRVSFTPTEHNAAWTQNKVGEFVPEVALWGGGKRARSSLLFVQKRLIWSVGCKQTHPQHRLRLSQQDRQTLCGVRDFCIENIMVRGLQCFCPQEPRHRLATAASESSLDASLPLQSWQWLMVWSRPQTRFSDE